MIIMGLKWHHKNISNKIIVFKELWRVLHMVFGLFDCDCTHWRVLILDHWKLYFFLKANAKVKRFYFMEIVTFDDFLLVSISIFNSRLFWILFSVHYKYDSRLYMDFWSFWWTWFFFFYSIVVVIKLYRFNDLIC